MLYSANCLICLLIGYLDGRHPLHLVCPRSDQRYLPFKYVVKQQVRLVVLAFIRLQQQAFIIPYSLSVKLVCQEVMTAAGDP